MRKSVFLILFLAPLFTIKAQQVDSIIDIRDDQVYKVVKIGQQWWMRENLNIGTMIDSLQDATDNDTIEKYCYRNSDSLCNIYGGLYQWNELMDYNPSDNGNPGIVRGVCPFGWHLPTNNEWTELTDFLGGESLASGKLKEEGTAHWESPNAGATNQSGFTALPGGDCHYNGYFENMGNYADFWASTESSTYYAWSLNLSYNEDSVAHNNMDMNYGFSVRCLIDTSQFSYLSIWNKNFETISALNFNYDHIIETLIIINSSAGKTINIASISTNGSAYDLDKTSSVLLPGDSIHLMVTFNPPGTGKFSDSLFIESDDPYNPLIYVTINGYLQEIDSIIDIRDDQIYKVVKIGQQWWLQENLNIGNRINGSQNASDNGIIEKYCYGDNTVNCDIYGGLYQWNEMMDHNPSDNGNPGIIQGICPAGWHLPTDNEWTELTDFLGGESVAGGKLKKTGTTHWTTPNTGATNETGFTALPGGCRYVDGAFYGMGYYAVFWSSTESDSDSAWLRQLSSDNSYVSRYSFSNNKDYGFSVQCLRDSSQFGYLTVSDKNLETISRLDFFNNRVTDTIIIINSSSGKTINITSFHTNTSIYNLNKSSAVLSPGDSIYLKVIFNPTVREIYYSDTLRIESNDPYNPVLSVPLMGFMPETDSIIDIRDSQVYKVVKIGQQWWMQENLNVGIYIDGTQNADYNGIIEKYCYGDFVSNCDVYGGLYQWDEMMDYNPSDTGNPGIIRGICPVGWHLPTDNEWTELTDFMGGESVSGGKLKETGNTHWNIPNTGATNESGFTALPGGCLYVSGQPPMGYYAYFWSSTNSTGRAWDRRISYNSSEVLRSDLATPGVSEDVFSVRCLRDTGNFNFLTVSDINLETISILDFTDEHPIDTIIIINSSAGKTINVTSIQNNNPVFDLNKSSAVLSSGDSIHLRVRFNPPIKGKYYFDTLRIESDDPYKPLITIPFSGYMKTDSIIDIRDSQVYKVVKIGQQWWMQENLNIGTRIGGTQDATNNGVIEKYCYDDVESNCDIYGGLYQWDEMMDYNPSDDRNPGITRGICPAGWHLSTNAEWDELTDFLGGVTVAGGKLKETGYTHWIGPNNGATNESGFTGLPGGLRMYEGWNFYYYHFGGNWWSSAENSYLTLRALNRELRTDDSYLYRWDSGKEYGFSVRCLKDSCQFGYLTISDENFGLVTTLNFYGDDISERLILINSSAGKTINVSSIYTKNSAFGLNKSSSTLLPGDSIHFTISFNPPVKGIYLDTLFVESDDPYDSLITIPLNGTFPPEIKFTDSTSISCFGYSDGSATITPSLGTPPYHYQWDDPENTTGSTVTGLKANIYYHVTVTDSLGWTVTDSIVLSEPDSLEILYAITNVSNTGGNDGMIDITIGGGTEPYEYVWSNDSTSEDLVGIKTGEYHLVLEDQNSCVKEGIFLVKEPISLQFDKADASCYSFNNGWIDMTILGGNQPYSIEWSNDATTENIGSLQSGEYIVIVKDDFGVSATDSVDITEPELLEILSDYSEIICPGSTEGFINLYPSGGTPSYSYSWSGGATSQNLSDLPAGQYKVKVTDSHGCKDSMDFVINSLLPYGDEKICIVTIDMLTGKYLIIWEKTPGKAIEFYKIYREGNVIGNLSFDELSIFVDSVADPEKRSYLYKISIVDTCGNESGLSPYHKPIFLQYISSDKGVMLTWSKYEIEGQVLNFDSYTIYRGSDSIALSPLEENIPKEIDSYTDNDPNALKRKYYYRVAGVLTDPCYPTGSAIKKAESGPYSHSMSNIEDNRLKETPEGILRFSESEFKIIPNPFNEKTTLMFHNPEGYAYTLYIMDLSGKVCRIVNNINTSEYVLEKNGLQKGFYFLELKGPEIYRGKMVIE